MPDELPKEFPPRREIDNEIEHIEGAKPIAKASYGMCLIELEELKVQLKDQLNASYIMPP